MRMLRLPDRTTRRYWRINLVIRDEQGVRS